MWAGIVVAVYAVIESNFFGNNLLPQTPAEAICDGLVMIGTLLAMQVRA